MHMFAGYVVLACVLIRVLVGVFARPKSPFSISNPMTAIRFWIDKMSTGCKAKNPIPSLVTLSILVIIGLSAVSGVITDHFSSFEDVHEAISETIMIFILCHLGIVLFKAFKKQLSQLARPIYQHLTR
jgi:cytochrome b